MYYHPSIEPKVVSINGPILLGNVTETEFGTYITKIKVSSNYGGRSEGVAGDVMEIF